MDANFFYQLPTTEVAQLVRAAGTKVVVFPINGTRRWFMLEHQTDDPPREGEDYLSVIADRHIQIYQLVFDHGIETLLTPCFGPDLLQRGDDYLRIAVEGLAQLATHPKFIEFYKTCQVRVRFYGDYRKFFAAAPYNHLPRLFDEVTAQTAHHRQHSLFFGLFANDAAEAIAQLSVHHYTAHGCAPDKRSLIEAYYGEYVEPVDVFIGFDKFSVFDMPLIATGSEDLYFTISPSPYFTERQLREILYDHLYTRRKPEPDYTTMSDRNFLKRFYQANESRTLGVGFERNGIWYPQLQIEIPTEDTP